MGQVYVHVLGLIFYLGGCLLERVQRSSAGARRLIVNQVVVTPPCRVNLRVQAARSVTVDRLLVLSSQVLLVSASKVHEPCLTVYSVLSTVLLLLRIGSCGSAARVRHEFIVHRLSPRRGGFRSNCFLGENIDKMTYSCIDPGAAFAR